MTEDEAKTKWCPFARGRVQTSIGGEGDWVAVNRSAAPPFGPLVETYCIGSACMAWRPIMGGTAKNIATGAERVLDNGGFYNVRDEEYTPHPVGGYCGPAGKP